MELNKIYQGDCLQGLKNLPDECIDCCVTSPPYYGLRDYGHAGQIGLEETPEAFVQKMVEVFSEVYRVLKKTGTLWLNLGDSYWGGKGQSGSQSPAKAMERNVSGASIQKKHQQLGGPKYTRPTDGKHEILKAKDLIGIPWMVAFALRGHGWYLRQDIIWHKPNPMPESVTDRCTKAHEYIFLFSKSAKYHYDAEAILEAVSANTHARLSQDTQKQIGSARANGGAKTNGNMKAVGRKLAAAGNGLIKNNDSFNAAMAIMPEKRNKRSVWTVTTKPFSEEHFATFPPDLIVDCIKAGSSEQGCCADCGQPYVRVTEPSARYAAILGESYHDHSVDLEKGMKSVRGTNGQNKLREAGMKCAEYHTTAWQTQCECKTDEIRPAVILDPFMGAGTSALVAAKLNRNFIGFELNPEYIAIAERRLKKELGMFNKLIV